MLAEIIGYEYDPSPKVSLVVLETGSRNGYRKIGASYQGTCWRNRTNRERCRFCHNAENNLIRLDEWAGAHGVTCLHEDISVGGVHH